MNRSFLFTFLAFFLAINLSNSQKSSPLEFIPDGYELYEEYKGDLNNDGTEDIVLLIKATSQEDIVENRFGNLVDRNRRGIIVILYKADHYEKVVENTDCFLSKNEDGGVYMPPELWIAIEDNKLKIHFGHGRYGYWEYAFQYLESEFKLVGYESSENQGPKLLYQKRIDFIKKKKTLLENTNKALDDEEEIFEGITYEIQIDDLIKLSDIQSFDDLNMSQY